ncbi:MAG: hypothetical protein H7X84_02505 [Verrucomicrobia bacterium]|nr:hypothetical protein [Prolixibacteraceae bacterium]
MGAFSTFEKRKNRNVSDLKLEIFRQIDSLKKDRLEEIYGILVNFINTEKDVADWEKLTEEQQRGIVDAIDEIDSGKGIVHTKVMQNIRKKYSN